MIAIHDEIFPGLHRASTRLDDREFHHLRAQLNANPTDASPKIMRLMPEDRRKEYRLRYGSPVYDVPPATDHPICWWRNGRLVAITSEPYALRLPQVMAMVDFARRWDLNFMIDTSTPMQPWGRCLLVIWMRKGDVDHDTDAIKPVGPALAEAIGPVITGQNRTVSRAREDISQRQKLTAVARRLHTFIRRKRT